YHCPKMCRVWSEPSDVALTRTFCPVQLPSTSACVDSACSITFLPPTLSALSPGAATPPLGSSLAASQPHRSAPRVLIANVIAYAALVMASFLSAPSFQMKTIGYTSRQFECPMLEPSKFHNLAPPHAVHGDNRPRYCCGHRRAVATSAGLGRPG